MKPPPSDQPQPPPFCTLASDLLPVAPPPGTPESEALAAWEVLTSARVARSTGSGRMSLLARYQADDVELTTDRLVWIALHPFEGASERWACRLARSPAMSDAEVAAAIVQEMGGPAEEEDEMTTLGFWRGATGFYFDSRGPRMEITQARSGEEWSGRKRRIGRAALISAARRLLGIAAGAGTLRGLPPAPATHRGPAAVADDPPVQLSLL